MRLPVYLIPAFLLAAAGPARMFGIGGDRIVDYLIAGVAGITMLGVLVVVHEFGHFIVAKAFGVGVPIFSFGMGPRVAGVFWRGTDYRISTLPIGGYVKLAGADPFGEEDPDAIVDPDEDFMKKPIWQRLLVMLAGPGFNLGLPFILFTGVLMLGEPQLDGIVGTVRPGSAADRAGIEAGDRIVAVDDKPVELWLDAWQALDDPRDATLGFLRAETGDRYEVKFAAADMTGVAGTDPGAFAALGVSSLVMSTRIGVDDPASPAAVAGLKTGDAVKSVDGVDVKAWDELTSKLTGARHELTYWRIEEGALVTLTATLLANPAWAPRVDDPMSGPFGLVPAAMYVGAVTADSNAALAGVLPNDRLFTLDGAHLRSWMDLVDRVALTIDPKDPNPTPRPVALTVLRGGEVVELRFAPKMTHTTETIDVRWRPLLGIAQYPDAWIDGPKVPKYYGPVEAFGRSIDEVTAVVTGVVRLLGQLTTGNRGIDDTLGGPVAIFRIAQQAAERGLFTYVRTIGLISISLGVFNLLPVPVLDGGQILFFTVEGLRGRPLSVAIREKLQMAGVLGLVALMLVVLVFDVGDWLSGE